jgi:hypothetical protein
MADRQRRLTCSLAASAIAFGLAFALPIPGASAQAETSRSMPAALSEIAPAMPQAEISWRVENPFRFFTDPADTEVHRATWAALTPEERLTPVLSAERHLARRHPDGWAAAMTGQTCWDSEKNRFICPGDRDPFAAPKSHRVVVSATGIPDAAHLTCTWLTAPRGGINRRGTAIDVPCTEPVAVDVPYPAGAGITLEIGSSRVAQTLIQVQDLFIVGLGDSFGSGEGNPDVPTRFSPERSIDYGDPRDQLTGYPARVGSWRAIGDKQFIDENARWLDQACHRSVYANQLRAALQLAIEDPHRAVTFAGLACSGAEITAGLFLRYKGNEWVPNPPELSQISAAADVQCGGHPARVLDLPEAYHLNGRIPELKGGLTLKKCDAERARRIDLVFLSIGGNDIGFARLVANAVLSDASMLKQLGGWFGEVHSPKEAAAKLAGVADRYRSLRRALHNILYIPWDESDRVLLTAYPGLALMEDGRSVCPDGRAGMDVLPDFHLTAERAREGSSAADRLHDIMRSSARDNGWTFVEAHRRQFLGRGLCAGFVENAFTTADDLRLPRRIDGVWTPYNPADYRPYAPRRRWFRTPNDAFLTGNFHVSGSLLQQVLQTQSLSWFQLLLASTYSGAFHPTAEGHAAIADALVLKARGVIEKYAGNNLAK